MTTETRGNLHCLRCGHKWYPQRPARPQTCPRCKSYDWDKPPEKKEK